MDRKKSTPFSFCHFNSASSMAKASMPQSTHDTMAIPLMKSALVIGIACLQLGHLYCLVEVISATRHNPAPERTPAFPACLSAMRPC
jgi:hypothetical protein